MQKTRTIPFAELRQFLQNLGYKENGTDHAHVFHRSKSDLLIFRRYADQEMVDARDLLNTRKFLDAWSLSNADDFDAFTEQAARPA